MTAEKHPHKPWLRWLLIVVFLGVFAGHALYLRHQAATPSDGWADAGVGLEGMWGFESYLAGQDLFVGFSYALGAAFSVWACNRYLVTRQAAMAAGAAGSITLVGILMAAGCFLTGCCGSPMLGVYLGLFGVTALGIVGKPLMALVTFLSVLWGHWYLSRRAAKGSCSAEGCGCSGSTSGLGKR